MRPDAWIGGPVAGCSVEESPKRREIGVPVGRGWYSLLQAAGKYHAHMHYTGDQFHGRVYSVSDWESVNPARLACSIIEGPRTFLGHQSEHPFDLCAFPALLSPATGASDARTSANPAGSGGTDSRRWGERRMVGICLASIPEHNHCERGFAASWRL